MSWHLFHKWEPVSADLYTSSRIGDFTLVLMRCACGKVDVERLTGCWTLEQIISGSR